MYENELTHYGIKGMKWGVRRFQKKDGGLTSVGRNRYSDDSASEGSNKKQSSTQEQKKARMKKVVKIGAAVAGTALAAYGAYKISNVVKDKAYNKLMDEGRGVVERNMARYKQNSIDNIRSYKRYANKTYGKVDQDKLSEMISKAGVLEADHRKQLEERLENHARRNSKTVVRAIKTLRGKN